MATETGATEQKASSSELPAYLDIDPFGFVLAAPIAYVMAELADPGTFWWIVMLAAITVVLGFILATIIQIQANQAYQRGRTDGIEFGRFLQTRDYQWELQRQRERDDS